MNRFFLAPLVLTGSVVFAMPAFAATTTTTTVAKTLTTVASTPATSVPTAAPVPGKFLVQLAVGPSKTAANTVMVKANTALSPSVFRVLTDTAAKKKTQYRVVSACLSAADAKALAKTAKAAGYTKAFASSSKSCKA